MKHMKQLSLIILMGILLFCSCNNNNEPDLQIEVPIISVFMPVSIDIKQSEFDEKEREEIMKLVNNKHIVNEISELPSDPIGQNEAFRHINFQDRTLLIMYIFKSWPIDTYSNIFYKDTKENSYNWVVRLGTAGGDDDETETIQLTRFAILVKKLPADAQVQTWRSLTQLGG